jgi:phospholipase/lecithinase/hemolysin
MRQFNFALALLAAATLAACGGTSSTGGDQALKTKFAAQVSFGDSLSDVGTYSVGGVKVAGGGKYTINGNNTAKEVTLTGQNWTELVAAQLGLPAPCAAQTGLDGVDSADPAKDFNVAIVNNASCFNYAQGGARVTDPIGNGHKATGSPLGQMTVPVVTQIQTHLTKAGGKFKGDELVTVMAGGNDVLVQLGMLSAAATAEGNRVGQVTFATSLTGQLAAGATNPQTAAQAIGAAIQTESARPGSTSTSVVQVAVGTAAAQPGNSAVLSQAVYGPMVAKAQADAGAAGAKAGADYATANGPKLVANMGVAGDELATLVKAQIIGKGANYVVVNNLPDVASTPSGKAQSASTQALIKAMVDAFNGKLKAGVSAEAKVLYVDLFAVSQDQVNNPGPYGLTNTSTPACGPNLLGTTSLTCTAANTIAGDVSHYMFADDIHPTPFEYSLVAKYVLQQMIVKGWL